MIVFDKEFAYTAFAASCAIVAAGMDIRTRRVSNRFTIPVFAVSLALHLCLDGWHGLLAAGAAGLLAGGLFLLFFLAGGMGGGDVKLIAAIASGVGLPNVPYLLLFTSLAGGVMGIAVALKHGRLQETVFNVASLASHHRRDGLMPHADLNIGNARALRMPYAVAIAAGSLATMYLQGIQR